MLPVTTVLHVRGICAVSYCEYHSCCHP